MAAPNSAGTRVPFRMFRSVTLENGSELVDRTLAANLTLTLADAHYLFLDPGGAGRDVTLPAEKTARGMWYCISNTADATEALTVKSDAPATIATINRGETISFYCDGTAWRVTGNSAGEGAGSSMTLTVGAEAADVIAVTVASPVAGVAQYIATVFEATMIAAVAAAATMAETGAGAEVSTTANARLLFTTDANGAAELSVTDVAGASGKTFYLEVRPAAASGALVGAAATTATLTFD